MDYIKIGESSILKNGFTLNIENTIKNKTLSIYVQALTDSNSNICFHVDITEDVRFAKPLYKSKVYTITELEESISDCVSIIDTFNNC